MDISDLFSDAAQHKLVAMAKQSSSQLSEELVRLIDQYDTDTDAVGELYSTWVLPQFIITSKILKQEDHPLMGLAEQLRQATEEIEPAIEAYLDTPTRHNLIELGFEWLPTRAASQELLDNFSAT